MVLSLLLTTTIVTIVFIPIALYFYRSSNSGSIAMIFYGGATWSIVAVVQFIVLQLLNLVTDFSIAESINLATFSQVQTESRTILFWYIFFISLIGQIILYNGTIRFRLIENREQINFLLFGVGWGLSEFVQRFLFFDSTFILKLYLFVFIISLAASIGATIVRTPENTKFVMFATFMKFIAELSLFGGLGYDNPDFYQESSYVLLLTLIMTGLAMITRKHPLKEDSPDAHVSI